MILPIEIIENILRRCDGKTLLSARKVDEEWKYIVDYLTQVSFIYKLYIGLIINLITDMLHSQLPTIIYFCNLRNCWQEIV